MPGGLVVVVGPVREGSPGAETGMLGLSRAAHAPTPFKLRRSRGQVPRARRLPCEGRGHGPGKLVGIGPVREGSPGAESGVIDLTRVARAPTPFKLQRGRGQVPRVRR